MEAWGACAKLHRECRVVQQQNSPHALPRFIDLTNVPSNNTVSIRFRLPFPEISPLDVG